MSKVTQSYCKTKYVSVKISYPRNPEKDEILIMCSIRENGVANIENIKIYLYPSWMHGSKPKNIPDKIQITVNRHDLALRLLNPPSDVWSSVKAFDYFEEDEMENLNRMKFTNDGRDFWLKHAGTSGSHTKDNSIYFIPNKVLLTFNFLEKYGEIPEMNQTVEFINKFKANTEENNTYLEKNNSNLENFQVNQKPKIIDDSISNISNVSFDQINKDTVSSSSS